MQCFQGNVKTFGGNLVCAMLMEGISPAWRRQQKNMAHLSEHDIVSIVEEYMDQNEGFAGQVRRAVKHGDMAQLRKFAAKALKYSGYAAIGITAVVIMMLNDNL